MQPDTTPTPARLDLTLVVPALNEERNIAGTLDAVARVLASCPGKSAEMLVIDDGSTDRTAAVVEEISARDPRVVLVRNPENLGLGASLQIAIARAAGRQLLIVPGDNDLPSQTLLELIRNAGKADMVMCYFENREQRGRVRNLLSTLFGLFYTTCFDVYPQYINGPCVYPVANLRKLRLFSTRFSIVAEINVKLLRQGVSFLEVPSYRQVGMKGSSSFSLSNLGEAAAVFCRLLYDVYVANPGTYAKRPVRVRLGP
jgi:glycosyltransferase involved in cell wall biosynthesis